MIQYSPNQLKVTISQLKLISHKNIISDIAIPDNLIQGLIKSNKDMSVKLSNMEQKMVVLEKELNVSTQRM